MSQLTLNELSNPRKYLYNLYNELSLELGRAKTNKKGQALQEAFTVLYVVLLNDGDEHTFQIGNATSRVD